MVIRNREKAMKIQKKGLGKRIWPKKGWVVAATSLAALPRSWQCCKGAVVHLATIAGRCYTSSYVVVRLAALAGLFPARNIAMQAVLRRLLGWCCSSASFAQAVLSRAAYAHAMLPLPLARFLGCFYNNGKEKKKGGGVCRKSYLQTKEREL